MVDPWPGTGREGGETRQAGRAHSELLSSLRERRPSRLTSSDFFRERRSTALALPGVAAATGAIGVVRAFHA
jgi:hypothetical protein